MDIVWQIRNFVEEESRKPESKYGYEPFIFHFIPMVNYARKLTEELGGDQEVVLLAAWLHDIGSIRYGRKDHHLTGAKIAQEKLKELNYPAKKIKQVQACIRHHRGSKASRRRSLEEKIVAEADALSSFDNLSGIFKAAFVYENLDQREARKTVREKLERKWEKLHFESSRKIIRPKYEAVKVLLGGGEDGGQ